MVEYLDFDSDNLYFDSDIKFKQFIEFWDKNNIPVECYWGSNLNGPAVRWRISDLSHNQQKWIEAAELLRNNSKRKPSLIFSKENIQIDTIEQLKLLHAVSIDFDEVFFKVLNFDNW